MIEHNFGTWKAHEPKPSPLLPPLPTNQPSSTEVPNASRVQTEVTLAETLPVNRSNPDYYTLNLGSHVLDGAFYASRLSRDLRENTGLVYSVSSTLDAGPTGSFYTITYGCDPHNVSRARAIVERDLKEMQTHVVPEEVLNQAKVLLLQQILLSESSVLDIADGLISRTKDELPLDEPTEAARVYVKLTPGQVQAAFAKWIRLEDLVQVTEGPSAEKAASEPWINLVLRQRKGANPSESLETARDALIQGIKHRLPIQVSDRHGISQCAFLRAV